MFIEATRSAIRETVQRTRDALIEYDSIVFTDVDLEASPQEVFHVVQDGSTFVVAFTDPTIPERDCGS